ncbi:hypothetical protein RhiirA4_452316 [Rhizophagus irregularis]|uniref:F-box domain-containing protein n=1 Tax=Rhizophagus irregularis TaxID=588596 RepID=A0A2I1FXQ3_9GLOM|nr:hypothetical protein RhiirA4_452316 [Rhizophagus irregularis]
MSDIILLDNSISRDADFFIEVSIRARAFSINEITGNIPYPTKFLHYEILFPLQNSFPLRNSKFIPVTKFILTTKFTTFYFEIKHHQKQLSKRKNRFNPLGLPTEILLLIFKEFREKNGVGELVMLRKTCRRFNNIINVVIRDELEFNKYIWNFKFKFTYKSNNGITYEITKGLRGHININNLLNQNFVEIEIDEEKFYNIKVLKVNSNRIKNIFIINQDNIKNNLYYESFLHKDLTWLFFGERDLINEKNNHDGNIFVNIFKVNVKCIKIYSKDFIKVFMS